MRRYRALVALALALTVMAGCTSDASSDADGVPTPGSTGTTAAAEAEPTSTPAGESSTESVQPDDSGEESSAQGQDDGGAGFPVSLCDMTSDRWAAVVDPTTPASAQDDGLRDGVALLESRLAEWRTAAAGDPAAQEAVELAATVSQQWRAALTALDEGDLGSADAALADSQATIDELDSQLEQLGSDSCD